MLYEFSHFQEAFSILLKQDSGKLLPSSDAYLEISFLEPLLDLSSDFLQFTDFQKVFSISSENWNNYDAECVYIWSK